MDNQYVAIKPVHKDLLHAKIADAIMEYIKGNQLKSGDKLPSERVLAEKFSTSRNSVREALRVLEKDNIIEVRPGSGAYVTDHEEADSFYLKVWKVNYMELLELKEVLELHMMRSICGKLSPEQLRQLEEPLIKLEEAAEMRQVFLHEEDIDFHRRLRSYCENKTMAQMLDNMITSLHTYWQTLEGEENKWIQTLPYHRVMLDAIRDSNIKKAEKAVSIINEIDREITEELQELAAK